MMAARELIVERGWSSASNRAIADRAGVNLALINYHFGGKRGLLAAVLDQAAVEIAVGYGPPPDAQGNVAEFVAAAVRSVTRLKEDPNARVLAVATLEATYDPEIAAGVTRSLVDLRHRIQAVLEKRAPAGASAGLTILLAALMDGILFHCLLDPNTDVEAAAAAALSIGWTNPSSAA